MNAKIMDKFLHHIGLRFMYEACHYDAEAIEKYVLKLIPKICLNEVRKQ